MIEGLNFGILMSEQWTQSEIEKLHEALRVLAERELKEAVSPKECKP